MDANEIVKTLKWLAEGTEFVFAGEALDAAADLIESLQAQLAAKDAEIARLTAGREALFDQLRRTDLDCDLCKHNIAEDCNNPDPDCETCHLDCACKGCIDSSKWEWRGSEDVICD